MSEQKGFVRSIWRKLSGRSKENPQDGKLTAILAALQAEVTKTTNKGEKHERAALAALILPKIFDESLQFKGKDTKAWALACGQMVGLLAGLAVKSETINGAIQEVMKEAKKVAHAVDDNFTTMFPELAMKKTQSSSSSKIETKPRTQSPSDAALQRSKMIEDLKSQAMYEQDPAAKAALNMMAERMEKEDKLGSS